MWELMNIGIEMQERMIEAHSKSLEIARDLIEEASAKQGDMAQVMQDAGKAHAAFIDQWLDYWRPKG